MLGCSIQLPSTFCIEVLATWLSSVGLGLPLKIFCFCGAKLSRLRHHDAEPLSLLRCCPSAGVFACQEKDTQPASVSGQAGLP